MNHVGALGGVPQQAEQSVQQEPPAMRVLLQAGHAFQTEAIAQLLVAIAQPIRHNGRHPGPAGSPAQRLSRFFFREGP